MLLLALVMAASQPQVPPAIKARAPAKSAAAATRSKRLRELQELVRALPDSPPRRTGESGPQGM
jgi:hypothetical protein